LIVTSALLIVTFVLVAPIVSKIELFDSLLIVILYPVVAFIFSSNVIIRLFDNDMSDQLLVGLSEINFGIDVFAT
jgi:hypothetical protein